MHSLGVEEKIKRNDTTALIILIMNSMSQSKHVILFYINIKINALISLSW